MIEPVTMTDEEFARLLDELIEAAKETARDSWTSEDYKKLEELRGRIIQARSDAFDEGYVCGGNNAGH